MANPVPVNPSPESEETIFAAAVVLTSPAARAAYLDQACAGRPELRRSVEELLGASDAAGTLLDSSPVAPVPVAFLRGPSGAPSGPPLALPAEEGPGTQIGRYKLLEKIGEGGFGEVYVAEQREPVKRKVALKIIKLGMDTRQVIARFEAERQALAMMDHPNIAKVLDAGSTDAGRPYFVMELVRGHAITRYCDDNQLTAEQRLKLFVLVCHAIQHAHQKGIIHRDIKPSNILVTLHDGVPVPKVIDFGIAKATQGELTDKTIHTQFQSFIGTPAYVSPEQVEMSGLDIDTRSDIYALGVLLYELLVGRTPFDGRELLQAGLDSMRRTIRETEPVRPSTRLSTLQGNERTSVSQRRGGADVTRLAGALRGDVDWIVMKCLEKDRTRRYETANGLAADITRHLTNEPVTARPPTAIYRFEKAFRRNRIAYIAAGAITGTILIGLVGAITLWKRADVAYRHARGAQLSEEAQRLKAEASERTAEESERAARQWAYTSDINLAQQALAINKLGRARDLLDRQRPRPGGRDLRGWEWRYLWLQTRGNSLGEICRRPEPIYSLSISGDRKWLAVGDCDKGGLSVLDLVSRREVSRIPAGDVEVGAVFSPHAPVLAFSMVSGTRATNLQYSLGLWDGDLNKIVLRIPLGGRCGGLAFSGDGQVLVALVEEPVRQLTAWRISDGGMLSSQTAVLELLDNNMTPLAVTRDGRRAAHIAEPGNRVRVLDLRLGRELWFAQLAEEGFTSVAFSADGRILASGSWFAEGTIRLWDVDSGREIARLPGHRAWIGGLVFSSDGRTLASASADHTIRLWDIRDPQHVPFPRILRGHQTEVWRVALSPDDVTLISGGKDGSVCLWDTREQVQDPALVTLPGIATWRFVEDGRGLLTVNQLGRIERRFGDRWDVSETCVETGDVGARFWNSRLSRDGRLAAISSSGGVVTVWDLVHRSLLREIRVPRPDVYPRAFTVSGTRLITVDSLNTYREWDLASGVELQSWRGAADPSGIVIYSANDQRCIDVAEVGASVFRDLSTGHETFPSLGLRGCGNGEFSVDGALLALPSSSAGVARVWETSHFEPVATFSGFMMAVHSVSFSPDSRRLVTGSGGIEAVKLWDLQSQHELITLEGKGSIFRRTLFSPDGNVVSSMSGEGLLHLWRAPSWEEIAAAEAKDPPSLNFGGRGNAKGDPP